MAARDTSKALLATIESIMHRRTTAPDRVPLRAVCAVARAEFSKASWWLAFRERASQYAIQGPVR